MNGGDQLVQRVMGLVLQPAFEIASVLWPGDHERLGCPSCPDHVDELLHPAAWKPTPWQAPPFSTQDQAAVVSWFESG
jgi:hypothetical protein